MVGRIRHRHEEPLVSPRNAQFVLVEEAAEEQRRQSGEALGGVVGVNYPVAAQLLDGAQAQGPRCV